MKKIVLVFILIFALSSCSNDDTQKFYNVLLPTESVEMPAEFVMGQTYTIKVWYYKPSDCHSFNGFYYNKYLNQRTIAVQNMVLESSNCHDLTDVLVQATFDFNVTSSTTYLFKFWTGVDDEGQDTFIEMEIPVVN